MKRSLFVAFRSAWDVAVDLRRHQLHLGSGMPHAPLAANALVIPEGCAHSFQVMEPETELLYLHSGAWVPGSEAGVHCCDPQLRSLGPCLSLA